MQYVLVKRNSDSLKFPKVRKTGPGAYLIARVPLETQATFPLNQIAFRVAARKSTYPIRNVQLSEAERNNISPLHAIIPLEIAFLKGTDRCFFSLLPTQSYPVQSMMCISE
jgi:hypothetical protein